MTKKYYTARQYSAGAALLLALAAPALAQVPDLPLLNLPPPPGISIPGSGNTAATAPTAPPLPLPNIPVEEKTHKTSKANPNPADLLPKEMLDKVDPPKPSVDQTAATTDADGFVGPLAPASAPPPPETASAGTPETEAENALVPPPAPFAGTGITAPPQTDTPPSIEVFGPALEAASNQGLLETKTGKTWETTLAPSRTYPSTTFNYKRVVLPQTIYRSAYSPQNRHLPVRRTRNDYDRMFIQAAARNDINGVRALLQSGRDLNTRDENGDSALIVAVRAGAHDTARLLLARGANPGFYGRGGKTAFDYARRSGNQELAKMLVKRGG